ncbi:hypothetical protein ACFLXB_05750 [Chloroflexota bacterium]
MKFTSFRHIIKLSSYLDGKVSNSEEKRIKDAVSENQDSQEVLNLLQQVKTLLKKTPQRKVSRNFLVTEKMVGMKPPIPRSVPVFRMASVTAALVLVVSFTISDVLPTIVGPKAASVALMSQRGEVTAYGVGGGNPDTAPQSAESPLAPEFIGNDEVVPNTESGGPAANMPESLQAENPVAKIDTLDQEEPRFGLDSIQLGILAIAISLLGLAVGIRQYGIIKWRKRS